MRATFAPSQAAQRKSARHGFFGACARCQPPEVPASPGAAISSPTVSRKLARACNESGAVVGAIIGATTGAMIAAEAQQRPSGYYWWRGGCYYRYPNGDWLQVQPGYCAY